MLSGKNLLLPLSVIGLGLIIYLVYARVSTNSAPTVGHSNTAQIETPAAGFIDNFDSSDFKNGRSKDSDNSKVDKKVSNPALADPAVDEDIASIKEMRSLSDQCKKKIEAKTAYYRDNQDVLNYELDEWALSRGYRTYQVNPAPGSAPYVATDYDTYNAATLAELAENGDMMAAQMVAETYYAHSVDLNDQNQMLRAVDLYRRAAVLGSTKALFDISSIYWEKSLQMAQQNSPESIVKSYQLHAMSWREVGGIRKDLLPYKFTSYSVDLSLEDWQRIDEMAQHQYGALAATREYQGLTPYDNSPSETGKIIDEIIQLDKDCATGGDK